MFFDRIVGPISQKYCLLFYIFSIVQFFQFVLFIFSILYILFFSKTKIELQLIIIFGGILILQFIVYIQYRLLYNMCINSI